MDSDDLRHRMERVGDRFDFGEYEIEAYLAVLDHGQLTASEIADHTDIPQPRVYDTVRKLSDRGMVELRESRPMRVVALDPEEVFPTIQTSLDEMIAGLSDRYTTPSRDTEAVSLVKSRPSILRYLESVIESAEYEIVLSLTPSLLDRFEGLLKTARENGVTIELIVTPAAEAVPASAFDYSTVATVARARRGITTPVMAVADGSRSVYATQSALTSDTEHYGVIFNRSALGFLVSGFFNTVLWTTAEPIMEDDQARSFPRRYASIRRCVRELAAMDRTCYAHVVGRDVQSGRRRTVSGVVVDSAVEPTGELATVTIETDDGDVTIGGRVAALEDIEAHEIHIDTTPIED